MADLLCKRCTGSMARYVFQSTEISAAFSHHGYADVVYVIPEEK